MNNIQTTGQVDRKILIEKLKRYGKSWFKSYLEKRTQRVKFSGVLSDSITVKLGVSQESVLRPLLFLISINDLTKVIFNKYEIRL